RVKLVNDSATSPAVTLGETPSAVSISPNTTHGWRPISRRIQPKLFAATGRTGRISPAGSNQRDRGVRPPRCAHHAHSTIRVVGAPSPLISRELQWVAGRYGAYEPAPNISA